MEQVLKFVVLFGKWTLCFPLEAWKKFPKFPNPLYIFQIILFLYSLGFWYQGRFILSRWDHKQLSRSQNLTAGLVGTSETLVELLVRLTGILLSKELKDLVSHASKWGQNVGICSKWLIICMGIFIVRTFGGLLYYIWGHTLKWTEEMSLIFQTAPDFQWLDQIALFFVDMLQLVTLFFALSFVVVIGLILLNQHRTIVLEYQNSLLRNISTGYLSPMGDATHVDGKDGQIWEELTDNFIELKIQFDNYSKIGGLYCLGVLIISTMSAIHSLIHFPRNFTTHSFLINGVLLLRITNALMLFFMAVFGSYLQRQLKQQREYLENFYTKSFNNQNLQAKKLYRLLKNWKWKLTAVDCVDINHRIIPVYGGTVLTYFIVMLQLQASGGSNNDNSQQSSSI